MEVVYGYVCGLCMSGMSSSCMCIRSMEVCGSYVKWSIGIVIGGFIGLWIISLSSS